MNNASASVPVDTSNKHRRALKVDTTVDITLSSGEEFAGVIEEQQQFKGSDSQTVWRTTIAAADALPSDATNATVTVTEVLAADALIVPVGALLALAEGGFGVEAVTGSEPQLVGVALGEILDSQAEVSGGLTVGDQVVIPT
ncbi:MAG: hypothetical protein ACI8Y4_003807 [Candidatus Poriferisodalaceae bacterium]